MWEEGVHIYGTSGIPNNFPWNRKEKNFFHKKCQEKKAPKTRGVHGSSRIGPGWSTVGSVKVENMLPEVQIGGNYMFF